MKVAKGIAGAPGCAVGRALVLQSDESVTQKVQIEDTEREVDRFCEVQKIYAEELEETYRNVKDELGEDTAKIFLAYQQIVLDQVFFKKPLNMVKTEKVNVDYAIEQEKQRVIAKFLKIDNPYMRERAADIENVCNSLIRRLQGKKDIGSFMSTVKEPFIIVAEDLSPEETVKLNKKYLRGFVTEKGGITSHAVILAKTMGIPAIVGAADVLSLVEDNQMIGMDGKTGEIIIEPTQEVLMKLHAQINEMEEMQKQYEASEAKPAMTLDGHRVHVCINSGDKESMEAFCAEKCDGIGLFRTEFLYMGEKDYPSEDRQLEMYKMVAEAAKGKEVIIRTLDIGGDKQLEYMKLPVESNPFLGYRAIRLCLDRKDVFKQQIRAILRASAYGNIKIMFPMIVTVEEFLEAKGIVNDMMKELQDEKLPYKEDIEVGVMIETPAAVQISDKLAKYVDFFSIGTNDLIQYTTATDRMNERVQYLYDPCNLSVLRSIYQVIQNGHKEHIPVGMCGEVAGDERLLPLLLAMGLDEFSVVPGRIGRQKYLIGRYSMEQLKELPARVMAADTIQEVKHILEEL